MARGSDCIYELRRVNLSVVDAEKGLHLIFRRVGLLAEPFRNHVRRNAASDIDEHLDVWIHELICHDLVSPTHRDAGLLIYIAPNLASKGFGAWTIPQTWCALRRWGRTRRDLSSRAPLAPIPAGSSGGRLQRIRVGTGPARFTSHLRRGCGRLRFG